MMACFWFQKKDIMVRVMKQKNLRLNMRAKVYSVLEEMEYSWLRILCKHYSIIWLTSKIFQQLNKFFWSNVGSFWEDKSLKINSHWLNKLKWLSIVKSIFLRMEKPLEDFKKSTLCSSLNMVKEWNMLWLKEASNP